MLLGFTSVNTVRKMLVKLTLARMLNLIKNFYFIVVDEDGTKKFEISNMDGTQGLTTSN